MSSNKLSHDEFIKRAKISNPNLLILGTYTRAKDKIKYKCTVCGNENESVAYSILQGHGCPKCGIRERAKNRTKTQEKFVNELKEINPNIEVIGKYKGNAINIKCKCKICNNKWSPRPYDLLQGKGCKKCADKLRGQKKRNTHDNFIERMSEISPDIEILSKYTLVHEKVKCRCTKCKNEWFATPGHLLSNKGCPHCLTSKGEKEIKKFLEQNNISFKQQFSFEDCKNKRRLKFDFAIFNKNKLISVIEYQGKQHYKSVDFFGGEEEFKKVQKRDFIKKKYCKDNNINLIEITYKDKNIYKVLNENLNNLKENIQLSLI